MFGGGALRALVVLDAVDNLSKKVAAATANSAKSLQRFGNKAKAIGQTAMMGAAVVAAPLVMSTKNAAEFNDSMANVSTLIDTTTESMSAMSAEVLKIGRRVPVAYGDLTSALYDVRSAGIPAAEAMNTLNESARLGVAGLATTKEATDIMTSALNAFKTEGLSAAQTSDLIFKAVKAGKTTVSGLAQAFGSTAPIIQSAGVKLRDFLAATSALTTSGTPAAQAQTQIRAAVQALIKPSGDMAKIFARLNVQSGTELIKSTGSLGGAFREISKTAGAMGINLAKAMGSVEGLTAVQAINGAQSGTYAATLENMATGANAVNEAFEKKSKTGKAGLILFNNAVKSLSISIGNILLPVVTSLANTFAGVADRVAAFQAKYPNLTRVIVIGAGALAAFVGIMGVLSWTTGAVAGGLSVLARVFGFVTSRTIRAKVAQVGYNIAVRAGRLATAALSTITMAFTTGFNLLRNTLGVATIATKAATAAQWLLNIALNANPIGVIIMLIGLLIGAFVLMKNKWTEITQFFKVTWQLFKIQVETTWNAISGFFTSIWDGITGFFNDLWTFISSIPSKMYEAGKNIILSIWEGIKAMVMKPINAIKDMVRQIREYLPFSPAKVGPLRDIHRIKLVETIAGNIKPGPMIQAMENTTKAAATRVPSMGSILTAPFRLIGQAFGMPEPGGGQQPQGLALSGSGAGQSGRSIINFSPTINIGEGVASNPNELRRNIARMMEDLAPQLMRLIDEQIEQKERRTLQ